MNKKLIVSLSLMTAFVVATASAMAESTIYTDGIGRMHFLGKDPASNTVKQNYANPEQQDLTRKLYENSTGEMNNVDYKFKDYDNTFGFGRMDTQTLWKNKFANDVNGNGETSEEVQKMRGSMTYEKGVADISRANAYGATNFYDAKDEVTVIKDQEKTKKKHWWNKSK
ncbi:hypothetical protein IKQ21_08525 [bacterium]|nr:hypothetical protein [bacterium]